MAVSRGRGRNGGEEEFGTDTRPGTNGIINRKKRKEKKYIVAVAI